MRDPAVRRAGVTCAATCLAMAAAAPVLARGLEHAPGVPYTVLKAQDVVVPTACGVIGAALVWLRPRNAVGWMLLVIGTCGATGIVLGIYGIRAYVYPSGGLPAADVALALANWLWLPALFLGLSLLPLFYPSGRLPSFRWRAAVIAVVAGLAALLPVAASSADAFADWHVDARPPLSLPLAVQTALVTGGLVLLGVTSLACIGNAAIRLWRARPPERAQLAWLLTAVTLAAVLLVVSPVEWLFLLALAMVPVAVAVGVLRYGLLGIEVVLRPALLYGLLTLLVALVFAGVTTGLSAVLPAGPAPTFVAAAVVAIGVVPAHVRIRRFVARLVDGPAGDPLAALGGIGRVMAGDDADPLTGVLQSVVTSTGATAAELCDPRGRVIARYGDRHFLDTLDLALTSAGEDLGTLVLTAPPHGFTDTGRALVAALAPQVAVLVRTTALNVALDDTRRRLLDASQAERDRLRRELHDGLGPSLSGVALGLEATEATLRQNPDAAEQILARISTEVGSAVEEVRRILDGLRPGGLDALGLVDALRAQAAQQVDGLVVEVSAYPGLESGGPGTPLDPEVEAAAYRIAVEALTNARRHADAAHCAVRLWADGDELGIEVSDDGRGFPAAPHEGVGLVSMRHRAEVLGGAFELRSSSSGTTVVARLPRHRP
jgi:signal transduction histidine kinase